MQLRTFAAQQNLILKRVLPLYSNLFKLCMKNYFPITTWERTVDERHFCSLHDLKLLLDGRCLSC